MIDPIWNLITVQILVASIYCDTVVSSRSMQYRSDLQHKAAMEENEFKKRLVEQMV